VADENSKRHLDRKRNLQQEKPRIAHLVTRADPGGGAMEPDGELYDEFGNYIGPGAAAAHTLLGDGYCTPSSAVPLAR
jgi:hypothetical protein